MVNIMSQLDWAVGCPVIWPNMILGESVGCFWMRLTLESEGTEESRLLSQCGWASSNQLRA